MSAVDLDLTKRVLAALELHGVRYTIFGAVALNLHGLARFTAALDLFIEPTAENVERLRNALKTAVDDPTIDEISTEDLLGDYSSGAIQPAGCHLSH